MIFWIYWVKLKFIGLLKFMSAVSHFFMRLLENFNSYMWLTFSFFSFKILFIHLREREHTEGEREKQTPCQAASPM